MRITDKIVSMKKTESTNNQNRVLLEGICPMGHALTKIGTRWKPLILFKLINKNLRYTEIKNEIPLITERMLALSLRELEKDKLIKRIDFGVYPKKVEYSLTTSGENLNVVLTGICEWGASDMLASQVN